MDVTIELDYQRDGRDSLDRYDKQFSPAWPRLPEVGELLRIDTGEAFPVEQVTFAVDGLPCLSLGTVHQSIHTNADRLRDNDWQYRKPDED